MKRLAVSIILLLILGFMTGSLLPVTRELADITAIALFVVLLIVYYSPGKESGILKNISVLIILAVLFVLFSRIPAAAGRLAGVSILIVFLELVQRFYENKTGELPVLAITTLLFSFVIFLADYIPEVWWVLYKSCTAVSGFIAGTGQNGVIFGPTPFGYYILVFFAILYLVTFLFSRKRQIARLILLLLSLVIAELVYLLIYPFMSSAVRYFQPGWPADAIYLQSVLFLFLLLPTYYNFKNIEFREISFKIPGIFWFQLAAGIFTLLLMYIPLSTLMTAGYKEKVTFYEKGLLDWRIPVHDAYGPQSGGMFGLLPMYLEARGYQTVKISNINDDNLAETGVLVLINLQEPVSENEKESVWHFVREGGSLLVMGDHTDVGGLMGSFNDLLEPVPIKFRFDTARPARYGWRGSLHFPPHPVTYGLEDETDTQIWIGASLDCQTPCVPVITGRYAHSDSGDRQNTQGAFTGNMVLDPGEQMGDVVIAAEYGYGNGKVMVFGDTSSFQNGSLFTSYEFVEGVFRRLASHEVPGRTTWCKIAAGLCLILVLVFLTRARWSLITLLICGVALIVSVTVPAAIQGESDESVVRADAAYIDYSHTGRFDLLSWEDDSVGGLSNNLVRNGYLPYILRDFSAERLGNAGLLVIIAPIKPFQSEEIDEIDEFVDRGGTLVVSVGWEEKEAVAPLLESLGFYIDSVPLGPVNLKRDDNVVSFTEAWPVVFNDIDTKVFAGQWGAPIAVVKQYGRGKIVVIGDSYFLLNRSLEGSVKNSPGNMILFRDMLEGGR
ncbi:MAG: hypothetical protein JXA46_03825 [Dehalococcoidales bacterium]|nr:hypothetical protein [Dehalococcoidales bacterium]